MFVKLRDWISLEKIYWGALSANPNAIELLEANQDKIHWEWLSLNPNAMHLLEANPDKMNWYRLSENPNAIHILEANQDRIDLYWLSNNPSIFIYDYEFMQKTNFERNEEIHQYVYHPRFIQKYINKYGVEALDKYME